MQSGTEVDGTNSVPVTPPSNTFNKTSSALELYLKDIAYNELLTPQQEVELAKRIKKGDKEALEKMVESNLRFVITVAKEYQGRGLLTEDLIAEGNLGLIRAAKRFDETKGFRFLTYAIWWIRQGILNSLADKPRLVRLPTNKTKLLNKFEKVYSRLGQKYGREPTLYEVADVMEMSYKQTRDLLAASRKPISLDMPIDDKYDSPLIEIVEDLSAENPEETTMQQALSNEVEKALGTLTPREAQILKSYYGFDCEGAKTLEEIGKVLNLTKERVRQLKNRALAALRHPSKGRKLKTYLREDPDSVTDIPIRYLENSIEQFRSNGDYKSQS